MWTRPLLVLTLLAASMVVWFSIRMWAGDALPVWQTSCVLGAWAPLAAAAVFLYVRAVGDREDSVFAAWLVRAIGMHFTLAWLVGASDWLRGPPGTQRWNSDLGAPLVLLAFVPVFALCWGALSWILSVHARLSREAPPAEALSRIAAAPYRGAGELRVRHTSPSSAATLTGALAGLTALCFAKMVPWSPMAILAICAIGLAFVTRSGAGAVIPCVASLTGVAAVLQARALSSMGSHITIDLMFAWPWVALGAVVVWLTAVEIRLRLRRVFA
jgi:hypothetical protein